MRLTQVLNAGGNIVVTADTPKWLPRKLIWGYGKGLWGPRKVKYTWIRDFKFYLKRNGLKIETRTWESENRPPGTVAIDANLFAAVNLHEPHEPLQHPWPFQHPEFVPKSRDDPKFMQRPALLYNKHMTLYEGLKGASHFTNSIIESEDSLPSVIGEMESRVTLDEKTSDLLQRQLEWTTRGDTITTKMPRYHEFPRLNIKPLVKYNIHPYRRDVNILKTYQTVADMMIAARYGFVDRRIVQWPKAKIAFERDGHLCVLNLATEFVTTSSSPSVSSRAQLPVFDSAPESTVQKTLVPIPPVTWKINFEETNFYPEKESWTLGIQKPHQIQTIFLANNNIITKLQPDRFVKARSLLFMYGLAVAQARQLYGSDDPQDPVNYTDLPNPVTMQCVHYNMTKNNIIFSALQLNTLSFNEENSLKNQVWTEGPFDAMQDQEAILKKLVALNLIGASDAVTQNVK